MHREANRSKCAVRIFGELRCTYILPHHQYSIEESVYTSNESFNTSEYLYRMVRSSRHAHSPKIVLLHRNYKADSVTSKLRLLFQIGNTSGTQSESKINLNCRPLRCTHNESHPPIYNLRQSWDLRDAG
jgi:predicted deacetylase